MKQFKKILVGCLLVLALSSVTACGNNDDRNNNNTTENGNETTDKNDSNGTNDTNGTNNTNGTNGTNDTNGTNNTNGTNGAPNPFSYFSPLSNSSIGDPVITTVGRGIWQEN